MTPTPTISDRTALRWGNTGLLAAFVFAVGVVGIVLVRASGAAPLLPVGLVGVCVVGYLFAHPRLNFIVWLGGLVLLSNSQPGFQAREVIYGAYFYGYLAHWYGRRLLLYRRPIIHGAIDVSIALWLVLGLTLGVALGLFFSADPFRMRGEAIALTMIATYFPVKEFCIREKHGPAVVLGVLTWLGLSVTIENAIIARNTFAQATQLWEIVDVRTAGRELLLSFAGVVLLSALPSLGSRKRQVVAAILVAILLGGLLLTKSRAFWVQYLLAVVVLIGITPGIERRRLLAWCSAGVLLLLVLGLVFLRSYFELLIAGASARFATIGGATADYSLLNRFVEASAVLDKVRINPILGYGFGTEYSFFDIIAQGTLIRSYNHVGLVAVVYKFGLWGGLLVAFAWIATSLKVLLSSCDSAHDRFERSVLRGIFACLASMILPAITTSVFFEDEKLVAFILVSALGLGIIGRRNRSEILPET